MQEYDICILAETVDASVANKLADSIRSYRLPSGVGLTEAGPDYRRLYIDVSGTPLDDNARSILDHSRYLAVLCSPETRNSSAVCDRLAYFRESLQTLSRSLLLSRKRSARSCLT